MSMIEGIGDEVLQFFGFVFVTLLALVAWWSTGIRERPQIRTVLILEHRSPTTLTSQVPGNTQSERSEDGTNEPENVDIERSEASNENLPTNQDDSQSNQTSETEASPKLNATVDNHEINKRRLAYFKKSEGDADENSSDKEFTTAGGSQPQQSETTAENIRIRLKYLNDDQKLVEGRLQELLGDFKRRHFEVELSAHKLVRLIFNGKVLKRDDWTLQGCGLYDNCVVHCLVHAPQDSSSHHQQASQAQTRTSPLEWNLGILFYACLSFILGLTWYLRYHYSQLFTITSTAGLVAITGLFAVFIVGHYIPDEDPRPHR